MSSRIETQDSEKSGSAVSQNEMFNRDQVRSLRNNETQQVASSDKTINPKRKSIYSAYNF